MENDTLSYLCRPWEAGYYQNIGMIWSCPPDVLVPIGAGADKYPLIYSVIWPWTDCRFVQFERDLSFPTKPCREKNMKDIEGVCSADVCKNKYALVLLIKKTQLHILRNIFVKCKWVACEHIFKRKSRSSVFSNKNAFGGSLLSGANYLKQNKQTANIAVRDWCTFDGRTWALFNVSCLIWSPQGAFVALLCSALFFLCFVVCVCMCVCEWRSEMICITAQECRVLAHTTQWGGGGGWFMLLKVNVIIKSDP